ncbi:MAG TPA: endolytic transglycosylase MltG [Candidatus Caccousia avistercoris]|nr:endolytic transglycosylase MltG [Candidatus Caccousia avistercoris]
MDEYNKNGRQEEEELSRRLHEKRVSNFSLNIAEEDLESSQYQEPPAINSYSDPSVAQRQSAQATRNEKQAKKRAARAHKARNKQKRKGNRRFFRVVWLVMVVLVSLVIGQYGVDGINDMLAVGRQAVAVTVDIPVDPTTEEVADILEEKGIIQEKSFFILYASITNSSEYYSNGTFQLDTSMDYEAIINNLQRTANRLDTVTVMIPEGTSVVELAELLEENGVCSAADFLEECNTRELDESYDVLTQMPDEGNRYYHLEGYLFPDTYEFYKNDDVTSVVMKLVNNCGKRLSEEIRQEITDSGRTIDEVLTLASIIQAEAANKDDMYMVSSVLQNRLRDGAQYDIYTLDCDSTRYYPYKTQDQIPEDQRETFVSSYNTYSIQGLPPGPICNPGLDAIDAALHPAETNFYYFCHDAEGMAYYAQTAAQHQQNLVEAGLR